MDPAIARSLLALPDYNTAINLSEYIIPKDTIIIIGDVEAQPLFGDYATKGQIQIYLPSGDVTILTRRIK
jgi:hypothetical protein